MHIIAKAARIAQRFTFVHQLLKVLVPLNDYVSGVDVNLLDAVLPRDIYVWYILGTQFMGIQDFKISYEVFIGVRIIVFIESERYEYTEMVFITPETISETAMRYWR